MKKNLQFIKNKNITKIVSMLKKKIKGEYVLLLVILLVIFLPLVILIHQNYELYHSLKTLKKELSEELNLYKDQIRSLKDLNHRQDVKISELQNTLDEIKETGVKVPVQVTAQVPTADNYPKTLQDLLVKGILMVSTHLGQRLVLSTIEFYTGTNVMNYLLYILYRLPFVNRPSSDYTL